MTSLDRRTFLKLSLGTGSGLALAVYLPGCTTRDVTSDVTLVPNVFVEIRPDGVVAITVPRSEMGQGVRTALPMLVAEELEADWERVEIRQADADPSYGEQGTFGSRSVRQSWIPLRTAGAAAREMLIAAAAARWGVEPAACRAQASRVVHTASGRELGYGELTADAARLEVPEDPPLKDAEDFTLIGRSMPRVDTPDIVRGEAVYSCDVRVPGMLYAVVERCPVFGGELGSFDATVALAVPGVREVVELEPVPPPIGCPGGVAVVADTTWAALEGRHQLRVDWKLGEGADESSEAVLERCHERVVGPGPVIHEEGDADGVLDGAARVVTAEYRMPFLAHASMEPMSCTADVQDGRAEIWAPSQNPMWARGSVAQVLELPAESVSPPDSPRGDNVTVHVPLLGGGFGRRNHPDFPVEAALLSKKIGRPVKIQWTREDDFQHDFYRPASAHRLEAALDAEGRPQALRYRVASTAIVTSFGWDRPADWFELEGVANLPYRIPHLRVEYTNVDTPVPRGWWRSVDGSQNAFVRETFIDELATAAERDSVEFRLELFGEPQMIPSRDSDRLSVDTSRFARVLRLAAEKAGWGEPLPEGRARGIAVFHDHMSCSAEVVEASIDDGGIRVHRVVCAVDCGLVVNPRMVVAQAEGGILEALAVALQAEITVQDGRVEQNNFDTYPLFTMPQVPAIEVHLVPSSDAPTGAGEPGVPPLAPALANALFALTGKRVRRLPIRLEDVA